MSAIIKHMARDRDVKFEALVKGLIKSPEGWHLYCDGSNPGPFDAVIVAVPAEQAITLLGVHDFQAAKAALHAPSTACWTAMFAFPTQISPETFVADQGIIRWAARNSSKPGRTNVETWVVQAEADWSRSHLEEEPDWIAQQLFDELARTLGCSPAEPVYRATHRWRYASNAGNGLGAIWRPSSRLGVCGDWLLGPRAESAWLSGRRLASLILESDPQCVDAFAPWTAAR
jgi:renalase